MANIIILNGSPRAPKSNSKRISEIFLKYCNSQTRYFNISKNNHEKLCSEINNFSDVLLVFPLYVDSLPVTLLNFLKSLEKYPHENKPTISVIINCGFIEYYQNDIAVKMIELFCKQNNYNFGSVLKIGSGEAILDSPFKILVTSKLKKLHSSIINKQYTTLKTTMPISKKMFVRASTIYWSNYGKKFGVTKKEMQTMDIE